LYSLDFSQRVSSFDPAVMPERPGDGLVMRPLQIGDYYKGYLQLLAQLTVVGEVAQSKFRGSCNESVCQVSYLIRFHYQIKLNVYTTNNSYMGKYVTVLCQPLAASKKLSHLLKRFVNVNNI
jgi:hypothetical protein